MGEPPPNPGDRVLNRIAITIVACAVTILAVWAAASPGRGSASILLTPARAAAEYTPEQAAVLECRIDRIRQAAAAARSGDKRVADQC
jgi:hypothetical protein